MVEKSSEELEPGNPQTGNDLANDCWLTTLRAFQDRIRNDRKQVDLADDVCGFSGYFTVLSTY